MKKLFFTAIICSLTLHLMAQSLKSETDWLTQKLNTLVIDDEAGKKTKESKPTFKFTGSTMIMSVQDKDDDFTFDMNLSWQLKDVQKVSYKKENNGKYELVMNVPADRIKINLGFGKENSLGGSFKLNDKDKENHTSFTLNTTNENVAKELVAHFQNAILASKK